MRLQLNNEQRRPETLCSRMQANKHDWDGTGEVTVQKEVKDARCPSIAGVVLLSGLNKICVLLSQANISYALNNNSDI